MNKIEESYEELSRKVFSYINEDLSRHVYGDIIVSNKNRKTYISIHNDTHNITWATVITPRRYFEDYAGSYKIMIHSIIKDYMSAVCASVVHGFDLVDIYEK